MRRLFVVFFVLCSSVALAEPVNLPQPFERFTVKPDKSPPATIAGVYFAVDGAKAHGTIIFCHGYGQSKDRYLGYEAIRRQRGWNVAMFDFREHGESSKSLFSLTTLGYYEQWDLRAVVDWCEAHGAAKPYVLYGRSMGASTALLEAANDPRIVGVVAASPFKNAWLATQQITQGREKWRVAADVVYGLTYKKALENTDVPAAIAKRDDLRLYLICGELDCFPEADDEEILDASRSPSDYKHLVVAPGKYHWNVWSWKGDGSSMGHDELIETMLHDVEPATPPAVETAGSRGVRWWVVGPTGLGMVLVGFAFSRLRLRRRDGA
jgi:pimeloyl-ACP methyl ester carboxylesterase